jgi:DNA primase
LRINKLMTSAMEENEPDKILDEDPETDINLQHLLRATNHLKIAQNEFEMAKK